MRADGELAVTGAYSIPGARLRALRADAPLNDPRPARSRDVPIDCCVSNCGDLQGYREGAETE